MAKGLSNLKSATINLNKGKVVLFFPAYDIRVGNADHWMPFPYLYLAPFLEKAAYVVKIIDARTDLDWKNTLTKELKDSLALGVTSMTGKDLIPAMEASQIAKGMNNKVNIIWGGSHASALPEEIFEAEMTDYVLMGPAEFTLPKLLDAIYLKKEIPEIAWPIAIIFTLIFKKIRIRLGFHIGRFGENAVKIKNDGFNHTDYLQKFALYQMVLCIFSFLKIIRLS